MRTERFFRTARARWHAGLWAACVAAWGAWGHNPVSAQVDAWAIGTQAVVMPPGTDGAAGQPFALPQPNNPSHPAAWQYQGQLAQRSQHVRTAGDGRILFFEVDGNLYDGDGYLIADARAESCTECLEPGVMEFVSVPVPGSCGLFYLFSSMGRDTYPGYPYTHVQWSLLDMNADNPRFPAQAPTTCARKGRLVNTISEFGNGDYQQLASFGQLGGPFLEGGTLSFDPPTSEFVAGLLPEPDVTAGTPRIRVVESANANGDHWLFAVIPNHIYVYRVSSSGVYRVSPVGGIPYVQYMSSWNPNNVLEYFHDADAILTSLPNRQEDVLALAITQNNGLYAYPDVTDGHNLIVHYFDRNTGALLLGESKAYSFYSAPGNCNVIINLGGGAFVAPGLRGCAFRSDGQGLYLTGERTTDCQTAQPYAVHLDLESDAITDLSYAFGQNFDPKWTRSRIYRNKSLNGLGTGVYIPSFGEVGALQGLENLATVSFTSNAIDQVQPPELFNGARPVNCGFTPRFLDIGIAHDRYLSAENRGICCGFLQTHGSGLIYGHRQTPGMTPSTWTAINNPYNNNGPLTCVCDLEVAQGAQLNTNGLEIRFGAEAKAIVERGGRLVIDQNSRFTSIQCPGERWPGIQLEGQTHASNTPTNLQGNLRIYSSAVENAKVGVRTGRFSDPLNGPGDPAYYGGRVLAYNSLFKDCVVGARIERHHANTLGGGADQPNQSLFSNCDFVTTTAWPGGIPTSHIELTDVNHVRVHGSRFVNQDALSYTTWQRGAGIKAIDAAFTCLGYQNTNNRFEGLTVGVLAMVPDPTEVYKVDGMTFFNNLHGVFDFASTGGVITNNGFTTMASPTPLTTSSVGLSLFNAEGYIVERNTFTDQGTSVPSVGIHFLGQSYQDNEVYDNEFNDLNIGCMVQGRHAAYTGTSQIVPGLQMRCGDHLGNLADQLILYDGWVRHNQGSGASTQELANNRFFSSVTCDPGNNTAPSVHTYVAAAQPTGLYVNYHYYKHDDSPEQRQDCIELEEPLPGEDPWLSLTGQYFYDLNGNVRGAPFDKARDCASGKLDQAEQPGGGGNGLQSGYMLKQAELASAWQNYRGTMDRMKTRDLVGMIDHKPAHPSHALRDTLLGNFPLTDSVMITMLKREEPMDVWHLTQVLIQNSPLSPWVWRYIDHLEVLPSYFRALLLQYRNGVSLKQVLEQEIVSRQQEVQAAKVLLLDSLANDTMVYGRMQLIDGLLEADSLGDGLRGRYVLALLHGDFATAAQLADELGNVKGMGGLLEWGYLYMAHDGNLEQFSAAARDDLYQMAMDHTPAGGGLAWATLYHLAELDSLPTPELPVMFKSSPGGRRASHELSEASVLTVLPNPATDRIAFAYGAGLENGMLEIFDAQGRLMRSIPLNGQKGLMESTVLGWSPGLYVVRLMVDGHNLGSTKFNVVR